MNPYRRHLSTALGLSLLSPTLFAQEVFPNRAVKIVVAYSPGTGSDSVARIIANALGPILGESIIVDNRPGAGGMLGTEFGAHAAPDGYTLTVMTAGTTAISPAMSRNVLRYNAEKDFVGIGGLARSAFVIATANTPEAPKTFQELIARLKQSGGAFASPGLGTTTHLTGEIILRRAQVKATHVPYKGSSQSLTDTASGQVLFAFDTVGAALPWIKGNRLRALAVTGNERSPSLPDVPTIAESGIEGPVISAYWGLVAPSATPPTIQKKLSDALLKALNDPEVKTRLAAQEVEPYPLPGPELSEIFKKEIPMWTALVKENNLASD